MTVRKRTPLMQQYYEIKQQYADTMLLFQVGDFYELFFDDAKTAASFLGIALTKRGKDNGEPIPLCGVPMHAIDHYLHKLVKGGFKVALCDQLSEPKPGTVVERGVTRVLTPGTLTDQQLLDAKSASYLFSFFPHKDSWGLLFGELMTAQLFATVIPAGEEKLLESELARFFPDEIIVPATKAGKQSASLFKKRGYFTSLTESTDEQGDDATHQWIQQQFSQDVQRLFDEHASLLCAAQTFYAYLTKNQTGSLQQFKHVQFYQPDDFLMLDATTQKNLDIVRASSTGSKQHTLYALMDKAVTPMGSRMVKKWLVRPLIKQQAIEQRLDVVSLLTGDQLVMQQLIELLVDVGDVERIVGRIALGRAQLHDYLQLSRSLGLIPEIRQIISEHEALPLLRVIAHHLGEFAALQQVLVAALNDDTRQPWLIKAGFNAELDRVRGMIANSNASIVALERREQDATGINSLKIRYNNVHGYYIEVTKPNLPRVPDYYIRKQTLVGRERFITPELRALCDEITQAQHQVTTIEQQVFDQVKQQVYSYVGQLRKAAHALAHSDALVSFARLAADYGYVRPTFNDDAAVAITAGRHPVVESVVDGQFVPNDTRLDDTQSLIILTGPNMGGKSTYLRQVALISIMAQCGSFVPADKAHLALLDRIFTRIGSGDDLARGKSTFLVEMEETAAICKYATKNSLVILDEVGRGTSTFDGLALAQALVEHIYLQVGARCLFATHYHELTALKDEHVGIASYYAASTKTAAGIVFLYTILEGVADGSFGLEVAKLAQLPDPVIDRAAIILDTLRMHEAPRGIPDNDAVQYVHHMRAENSALKNRNAALEGALARLRSINYNDLSPKAAFDLLWEMKEQQS